MNELNEAWFSAQFAPWLSLLSLFSLLSYANYWAQKGQFRNWVLGAFRAVAGLGIILFAAGCYAYLAQQPEWVWFTLLLAGGILGGLMLWSSFGMAKLYAEAELRKSIANDL